MTRELNPDPMRSFAQAVGKRVAMPFGITDLAHSLRLNTASLAVLIPLSHGQQIVCARLGHKSLASFQATQDAELELARTEFLKFRRIRLRPGT